MVYPNRKLYAGRLQEMMWNSDLPSRFYPDAPCIAHTGKPVAMTLHMLTLHIYIFYQGRRFRCSQFMAMKATICCLMCAINACDMTNDDGFSARQTLYGHQSLKSPVDGAATIKIRLKSVKN